jgi:hypothetical protein
MRLYMIFCLALDRSSRASRETGAVVESTDSTIREGAGQG